MALSKAEVTEALKQIFNLTEPCTNGTTVTLEADCVDGIWIFDAEITLPEAKSGKLPCGGKADATPAGIVYAAIQAGWTSPDVFTLISALAKTPSP